MTATSPPIPGLPVEIGRIDKELGKLWEESGDTKARASLINLAIYTEDAGSVASTTELLSWLASEHACRAILIYSNPSAKESSARAWISAHCHIVGKGRQICSEQITFQLDGEVCASLPNIVFTHLDSDLPLYFWWQAEFREPLGEELWSWVDRLIFDSRTWQDPAGQFTLVQKIGALSDRRTVLCDLNWARLLSYRFALATFFDNSCALPYLSRIESIELDYNTGSRVTALLLLGWLAVQLQWTLKSDVTERTFRDKAGRDIHFTITEVPGASISRCRFAGGGATFSLARADYGEFFQAELIRDGLPHAAQVLRAGKQRLADTLVMELSRGGVHPLYCKALNIIEPLLG